MLIRKPIEEVFNSFIDPTVTTKFWFSRSTGPLKVGETITWYGDHYDVSGEVFVKVIETKVVPSSFDVNSHSTGVGHSISIRLFSSIAFTKTSPETP